MSNDVNLLSSQARALLGKVQSIFGTGNVTITSTERSAGSNASIKGASPTSQHLPDSNGFANAFDFIVKGMTPDQVQAKIASSGLSFGQSIQEYGAGMGPRNHLGVGTKGQLMTGNNGRYRTTGFIPSTNLADQTVGAGRDYFKGIFGDTVGNALADGGYALGTGLAAPGDALDKLYGGLSLSSWFQRITFGVFAILLIAVALFMLSGKSVSEVASKIPPIPV